MKFINSRVHTIIGLVVGAALLVAPWLFAFADQGGAAVMVPLIVGAFIIISELTTTSEASPFKLIPMKAHIVVDVITGLFLALSPWLLGFSNLEANAWVPHLVVGILVAGYALVTNTEGDTSTTS